MFQLVLCLAAVLVYTGIAIAYFLKKGKEHWLSMAGALVVIEILICVISYHLGTIFWFTEMTYITMIAVCIPVAWIDAKERIIPNEILLTGLIIQFILFVAVMIDNTAFFLNYLKGVGIGVLLAAVFCVLGFAIVKNGIGMGDVKLLLLLAIMGGIDVMLSVLFFTLIAAFFWGLYELIVKKKGRYASIPFAPAILFGVVVTLVLTIVSFE